MALYKYVCVECRAADRRLLTPAQARLPQECKECSGELKRTVTPPGTNVVELIDDGKLNRAIERHPDAERLHRERADDHKRKELDGDPKLV